MCVGEVFRLKSEFVFGADFEFPVSTCPTDLDSSDEWDLYWHGKSRALHPSDLQPICKVEWLEWFQKRKVQTILLVGNGFSHEPQFWAYAGYHATAMDLSAFATSYAARQPWEEAELVRSFSISDSERPHFLRSTFRLGGRAEYVQGDLFQKRRCSGPFDVIVVRRTLQLFEGEKLVRAVRALEQRLASHGLLIVEVAGEDVYYEAMCKALKHCDIPILECYPTGQKGAKIVRSTANEVRSNERHMF